VCFHPVDDQLVSCGYDKSVRLFDTAVGTEVRAFLGHELPVRQAVYNATGNLIVSGGKDATLFFWDERSALCVRKLRHSLGEVTSVQLSNCGMQLLVSSKDNAARLWDVRAARPLRAYKGHLNTCKNFVRARFGPGRDSVMSGSEDGSVCLWSLASAELLHRLRGHTDVVYDAVWDAVRAVEDAMRPGVNWRDMQTLAYERVLAGLKAGGLLVGEVADMMAVNLGATFMPHGLGHFLGIQVHDVGGRQKTPEGGVVPPPRQYPYLRTTRSSELERSHGSTATGAGGAGGAGRVSTHITHQSGSVRSDELPNSAASKSAPSCQTPETS
jgi:hypothetical protein